MKSKKNFAHVLAIVTIIIWGTTFISTKILLNQFSPEEILFLLLGTTGVSFFYGIITMLPILLISKVNLLKMPSLNISIVLNFLFLSIFASVLCFLMWNKAINIIGSVKTTNYIYFVPLITKTGYILTILGFNFIKAFAVLISSILVLSGSPTII